MTTAGAGAKVHVSAKRYALAELLFAKPMKT
jgi:hypothetical protein